MVLFEQVHDCLVVEFIILCASLELELTQAEEHSVVDVEAHEFSVGIL